jgi:hypothetical protein
MFPQQISTFHSWEIYTKNSSVSLGFVLHDLKGNQPNPNPQAQIYTLEKEITNSSSNLKI